MYKIASKRELNPSVVMMEIDAPLVAKKALPGQFIILRVDEDGERIPLTVAGTDRERGTVKIIFQIVGSTTKKLSFKSEGESITDFVGPLGKPTELDGIRRACIVGGGVGCAIALPIAEALHEAGAHVTSIVGFRSRDIVILEDEFQACSDELIMMTDDGSCGREGNVTVPLKEMLESGKKFDMIIAIGPLIMMKFVTLTGMCGGCRLTLRRDGERVTKFACVDGPDFDGYEVDFDEAMSRGRMYMPFERHAYEATCNLFAKEAE